MLLHLALRTWVSGPRWRVSLRHHDPQRQNVTEAGSAIENAETGSAIELQFSPLFEFHVGSAAERPVRRTHGHTDVVNLYIRLARFHQVVL